MDPEKPSTLARIFGLFGQRPHASPERRAAVTQDIIKKIDEALVSEKYQDFISNLSALHLLAKADDPVASEKIYNLAFQSKLNITNELATLRTQKFIKDENPNVNEYFSENDFSNLVEHFKIETKTPGKQT